MYWLALSLVCLIATLSQEIRLFADAKDVSPQRLARANQVRSLSAETASSHLPVQLTGVVLLEGLDTIVLHDGSAGIYLEGPQQTIEPLRRGDLLRVEGVTDPGKFAPFVKAHKLEKVGSAPIPEPATVGYPDLLTGRFDAQWIEVTGVVRRSEPSTSDDSAWGLWIAFGGGRLPVRLTAEDGRRLEVDSEVRLQGICFYQFNKARQAINPLLQIPHGQKVQVLRAAPTHPFSIAERPIQTLLQFSAEDLFSHRVHVSGVVTHAVLGEGFWLSGPTAGVRVLSQQTDPLCVGDKVSVLGFLSRGDYSPSLEDAVFRKLGKDQLPTPIFLSSPRSALEHDQALVQLDADIVERWRVPDGTRITLEADGDHFVAQLRHEERDREMAGSWPTGSRVRVSGICLVTAGAKEAMAAGTLDPGSFHLLIRSWGDLHLLRRPSWWTAAHVGWLTAGLMGTLLAIGGWMFLQHRRRVTSQMSAMKAQAALDSERTRIARDLHDEIGANLTHISILATLASDQPQAAQQHSAEAASVAQQTIRAFDEILWSINPKNDTALSLSHYLCRYAEEVLGPAGIAHHFRLGESYPERMLPPQVRHGVLLAVKEALHNVIKHSGAQRVEMHCCMETEHRFHVSIADDGRGMPSGESKNPSPKRRQGQGLANLERRILELGGQCTIESRSGKGTTVTLRLQI